MFAGVHPRPALAADSVSLSIAVGITSLTMFITSGQTLDVLQHHAPRAWCKRLLLWEIFNGSINVYFLTGRITEKRRPADYLVEALGEDRDAGLSLAQVERHFSAVEAEALRAVGCPERLESIQEAFDLPPVEVERNEWTGEPTRIPIGPFVYADLVDFENGRLDAEDMSLTHLEKSLFEEAEEFNTEFDHSILEVRLSGMCFELNAIEMLAPGAQCPLPMRFDEVANPATKPKVGPGRARKWDWDGALAHIAAIANRPDGLPEGHGAQAAVERMIAEWFITRTDGSPPESEIRKRAAQVMSAVQEGRK